MILKGRENCFQVNKYHDLWVMDILGKLVLRPGHGDVEYLKTVAIS